MAYTPPPEILEKYAKLMVDFALNSGEGVKPGEVVYLKSPIVALPFHNELHKALINSSAVTIDSIENDTPGMARYYFEHANNQQITAFPDKYARGLVDQIDHYIAALADNDIHELDGVDPKKILLKQKTSKPLQDWLFEKENKGELTWTLALYGTPSMAKEAGLSEKQYWDQIIHACYLDVADPIAKWRKISAEVQRVASALTKLDIKDVHVTGKDVDLRVTIGKQRQWLGGGGRNIPSFEVFTSPDWRGTEGWIKFNQPLYYYGPKVEGIELHFKKGRVVKATATKNQKLLKEMLSTDAGSSQLGEFSLTDKRLSRITKFMANTLFDENMGGPYGNIHLAVGKSYRDTYVGGRNTLSSKLFKDLGYNDSAIHTDMISTADRTVTATLAGGKQKIIYKNGQFTI